MLHEPERAHVVKSCVRQCAHIANQKPFYLQSSLDDINDQIRLLENITPEAQAEYFDPRNPEQIAIDEWQAESALTRESDRPY